MIFDNSQDFQKEISGLKNSGGFGDELPNERMQAVKQSVLQAIASPTVETQPVYSWREKYHTTIRYAVSVIVGLSLVGGTTFASNGSVPGDPLYGVKRIKEQLQLSVAFSDETKAELEAKFAENRLNELHSLLSKVVHHSEPDNSEATTTGNGAITSPGLSTTTEDNGGNKELENNAKADARLQVNNAIINLKRLQSKFAASGQTEAASAIQANIVNLQNKAFLENLDLGNASSSGDVKGESDDRRPNSNKGKVNGLQIHSGTQLNSTTTSSQFKVDVKIDNDADEHSGSPDSGD